MGKLIKFDYVNEHGDFEKVLSHFNIDYTKKGAQLRALWRGKETPLST